MSRIIKVMIALLAIAAFAAPAMAATVYKKDGFTYKIKGDLQIQLRQDPGTDQELDVEYDDLEIKNSITYDLDNNMTAFAQLDFGFKNAADKDADPHLEEAYVGFGIDKFSILFGKTDSAGDAFGIEGAIEEPLGEDVFDTGEGYTDGDDLIKAEADFGPVQVMLTHELEAESEASANGTFTDILVTAEFAGVELGAAYQVAEETDGTDIDTYGVSIGYSMDMFSVAADFGEVDSDNDADDLVMYNLFASYKATQAIKLGVGYQYVEFDLTDEDVSAWYANVTYKFPSQKNVSVFAEIADSDEANSDMGYLVGARVKF